MGGKMLDIIILAVLVYFATFLFMFFILAFFCLLVYKRATSCHLYRYKIYKACKRVREDMRQA